MKIISLQHIKSKCLISVKSIILKQTETSDLNLIWILIILTLIQFTIKEDT